MVNASLGSRFSRGSATWAIEQQARKIDVQRLLGHSTPAMLLRYTASYDAEKAAQAHASFSPGDRLATTLLVQGTVPAHSQGHYVRPIVLTGVPEASPLATEEIFGPVLAVFRAETFEEALGIATRSPFSLAGGVFSRNPLVISNGRRGSNPRPSAWED